MTDIVDRLRTLNADFLHEEAADEIERLREALRDLLDLCSHADFKNGVTDATGTMDEGEHWAAVSIDRVRAALGEARA